MATNATVENRLTKLETATETERPHLATKADLEKLKGDLTFRMIVISCLVNGALLGLIKIIP